MVNAIGHAGGPAAAAQANRPSAPARGGQAAEAQQPGFDEQAATVEISGGEGEQRGVIRNLLNGHYSGVAAVRLAINFHDELTAQRLESSTAAAQVSGESFAEQAAALVEGFVTTFDGTDQSDAVASAADDFMAALAELTAQDLTPEDLESAIRVELDGFAVALHDLLDVSEEPVAATTAEALIDGIAEPETTDGEPVATEPVDESIVDTAVEPVSVDREAVEGDPTVDPTVEPATEPAVDPIDALIAELEAALVDALAPSIESATSTLIDFGEPNGAGVAFAKFVAIYERLTAATEPEAPAPGELVDTEA